jgi:hypothetical protein
VPVALRPGHEINSLAEPVAPLAYIEIDAF